MSLHNGVRNALKVDSVKLSQARLDVNLSLSEVAIVLSCNKSQVSRWERGQSIPSDDRIKKMIVLYQTNDFVTEGLNG